jgi:hypothetical protein
MHGHQAGYEWTKEVAILWPNGDIRRGVYEDGYGNIAGMDLVEMTAIRPDEHGAYGNDSYNVGGWRLVHQRCLANAEIKGNGNPFDSPIKQLFATFKPERHASDQGWWPGERLAVERYGPPNLEELTKENTYVCYECNRTWKANWSGGLCPFGCVRPKNYRDSPELIARAADPNDWVRGDHNELVEPFRYLDYKFETADGVIFCQNETAERPDWQAYHANRDKFEEPPVLIEPCFYFNEPQQARVNKPRDWDEMEDEPFEIRCRSCKTTNVKVVELTPGEPSGEPVESKT